MLEDVGDNGTSNGGYKEQPPLRLPFMDDPSPAQASVSPRFDNIMGRSSSVPWSPTPMNENPMSRPSEYTSASRKYANTSDVWSANNPDNKTSEIWSASQTNSNAKRSDLWSPIPYNSKPTDRQSMNQMNNKPDFMSPTPYGSKMNDRQSLNQSNQKSSEIWSTKQNNKNSSEVWTTTYVTQTKNGEPWSANNSYTKTNESTIVNNDSSNIPMIKSNGGKPPNSSVCQCSTRCKLGILGFAIGLLLVAIPLAVILVLWLRQ